MRSCPDLSSFLPSKAKTVLIDYLVECFESYGIHFSSNNPKLNYTEALLLTENNEYARKIIAECYDIAKNIWEEKHPLCWSNIEQRAYRG